MKKILSALLLACMAMLPLHASADADKDITDAYDQLLKDDPNLTPEAAIIKAAQQVARAYAIIGRNTRAVSAAAQSLAKTRSIPVKATTITQIVEETTSQTVASNDGDQSDDNNNDDTGTNSGY